MLRLMEAEKSLQEWGQYLHSSYPSTIITSDFLNPNCQVRGGKWPSKRSDDAHRLHTILQGRLGRPVYGESEFNTIHSNYNAARTFVTPVYRLPDGAFIWIVTVHLGGNPRRRRALLVVYGQWNDCLRTYGPHSV